MTKQNALKSYYCDIFPYEAIWKVFNITPNRELSFFTQNDIYIRYITCTSPKGFHEKIRQIVPKKIDIGAIYSSPPTKLGSSLPTGHELVFDVDLTDYERECCDGKTVCPECYKKIKCAIRLFDYSLRKEFGFKEIGFVFSGRRGVHCWVFDDISLSSEVRSDIIKFYQHILNKNLSVPEYDKIMMEFATSPKDLVKNWFLRIDKSVTTTINHLLKLPFSVHPDSLKIAVPINPASIPELEDLPTLQSVVDDPFILNSYVDTMLSWRAV